MYDESLSLPSILTKSVVMRAWHLGSRQRPTDVIFKSGAFQTVVKCSAQHLRQYRWLHQSEIKSLLHSSSQQTGQHDMSAESQADTGI